MGYYDPHYEEHRAAEVAWWREKRREWRAAAVAFADWWTPGEIRGTWLVMTSERGVPIVAQAAPADGGYAYMASIVHPPTGMYGLSAGMPCGWGAGEASLEDAQAHALHEAFALVEKADWGLYSHVDFASW